MKLAYSATFAFVRIQGSFLLSSLFKVLSIWRVKLSFFLHDFCHSLVFVVQCLVRGVVSVHSLDETVNCNLAKKKSLAHTFISSTVSVLWSCGKKEGREEADPPPPSLLMDVT